MSLTQKRSVSPKMAPYKRTTVADASRHTTPEPKVKSLSNPKTADEVGCRSCEPGMSDSRYGHREGFTPNTGDVAEPYDCPEEEICGM